MEKKYRYAMSAFVTRYLGQEDGGSVLNYLKRSELATSLSAGTEFDTSSYTLIYVQIELTDTGLGQSSNVIRALNKYIGLLKSITHEDVFKKHFVDFMSVQQTLYDYGERKAPKDYIL